MRLLSLLSLRVSCLQSGLAPLLSGLHTFFPKGLSPACNDHPNSQLPILEGTAPRLEGCTFCVCLAPATFLNTSFGVCSVIGILQCFCFLRSSNSLTSSPGLIAPALNLPVSSLISHPRESVRLPPSTARAAVMKRPSTAQLGNEEQGILLTAPEPGRPRSRERRSGSEESRPLVTEGVFSLRPHWAEGAGLWGPLL